MGNTLGLFLNVDEKCQCTDNGGDNGHVMIDSCNANAKKTVVENTFFKEQTNKKVITAKPKNTRASFENLARDCRKGIKASRRPHCFLKYGCYDIATLEYREAVHKDLVEGTSRKLTSTVTAEAPSNQVHPPNKTHVVHECISCAKHEPTNGINVQLQMNEATEAYINQKLIDGKHLTADKAAHKSKQFFDTLEILNSNKDLFTKLLQDPNSVSVKHIEDLGDSQVKKHQTTSSIEAYWQENAVTEAKDYHKSDIGVKSLRSRAKSFSKGDSQSFEQIVVLKPGSRRLQNCEDDLSQASPQFVQTLKKVHYSVRASDFPSDKLKRKLTHAVGLSLKEEQSDYTGSNCICNYRDSEKCCIVTDMKIVGRTTGCKNSFDISGMTSSIEGKEEDWSDTVKYRTHICKLLNTGKANFLVQQKPKTWDGMIDMPNYDLVPVISHRRNWECGSVNPQMRFFLSGNLGTGKGKVLSNHREMSDSCLSPQRQSVEPPELANYEEQCRELQTLETILDTSYKVLQNLELHKTFSCLENDPCLRASMERTESSDCGSLKAGKPSKRSCELEHPHHCGSSQSIITDDSYLEAESSELSRPDLHKDNPVLSSAMDECLSSPLSVWRDEDLVSNKDTREHSSPVSVLERLLVDDVTSPSSTESELAEPLVPQQSGNAEDYMPKVFQSSLCRMMKSSALSEEHGFVIKYICEVLQGFDINGDNLSSNYLGKEQFFDQIVWEEDHVWPSQFGSNPTLLFQFIVEILEFFYQRHLRCSPLVSFILPKARPFDAVESITQEVMNYIVQGLSLYPHSRTLEQLVEKDWATSGMWMNIKVDFEEIVAEIGESILDELMVEAANE